MVKENERRFLSVQTYYFIVEVWRVKTTLSLDIQEVLRHKPPNITWRKNQEEGIREVVGAMNSGYRNIIIEGPCGIGKTLIYGTICGASSAITNKEKKSYIAVGLKSLQDQIEDDKFLKSYNIAILKGRANYTCLGTKIKKKDIKCDVAPCRSVSQIKRDCIDEHRVCPEKIGFKCDSKVFCTPEKMQTGSCNVMLPKCEYELAKARALQADICCTNLSMLATARYLNTREILVIDEAQMLETRLREQVSLLFQNPRHFPSLHSKHTDFRDCLSWVQQHLQELKELLGRYEDRITETKSKWEEALLFNPALEKNRKLWSSHPLIIELSVLTKEKEKCARKIEGIINMLQDYKTYHEEWVVQEKENKNITFQPLTLARFYEKIILFKGQVRIICSATPPTPKELNLEEEEVFKVSYPSPFPVQNRKCYIGSDIYAGSMTYKNKKQTLPNLIEQIIALRHGKTIVHCHSYDIAEEIALGLKKHNIPYILQNREKREKSLQEWMKSTIENMIFVSVHMEVGISLDHDLCRTNIIAKVPYPNLSDKHVKMRLQLPDGREWYNLQTARKIAQASGRSTRSKTDWSRIFILDQAFDRFYQRAGYLLPTWFVETLDRNYRNQNSLVQPLTQSVVET